ncbi:MAG TPA: sensor histidine kinase [Dehalococcoidia bacterium]|nr:sensor histidine kinase [Dehalococcoidia bacterium]
MEGELAAQSNGDELLAGFRLRTASVARNAAWITLAGIAALALSHHPLSDAGTHGAVWALIGLAAVANLATYAPAFNRLVSRARGSWPFSVWTGLLLAFDAAVIAASGDANHQIYLIYVPALLFAVATLEPWAHTAALAIAIASSAGALAYSGALTTESFVGSATTFAVVWLLGGYLSRAQREEILENARHAREARLRGKELAELHQRAVALAAELRATVAKVITAQEEERKRIGRELHDEAVQLISTAAMRVGDIERRTPRRLADVRASLAELRDLLTEALWEIRKVIVDLRPSDLDDLGLAPAVAAHARSHLEAAGVAVEMRLPRNAERLPPAVETAVFRIAQEAINNVARHARARKAVVALERRNGDLVLEVRDDGRGFDPAALKPGDQRGGLGLTGMRERAALLGGTLELWSQPGAGTVVRAVIPIEKGGEP